MLSVRISAFLFYLLHALVIDWTVFLACNHLVYLFSKQEPVDCQTCSTVSLLLHQQPCKRYANLSPDLDVALLSAFLIIV